jgi:hypothetical protein
MFLQNYYSSTPHKAIAIEVASEHLEQLPNTKSPIKMVMEMAQYPF